MSGLRCVMGIVGLGVMGRNLAFNMMDKGFPVAGYDVDPEKTKAFGNEAETHLVYAARTTSDFVAALLPPRAIMMLVPSGRPVDSAIAALLPHLESGDVLMDCGNSYFRETEGRARSLGERGIIYMGVGISGGERGARLGPSIMPGGPEDGYERVRHIFEAVASHVDGGPCVAYLGSGSAGTYVKMVHNGIEYGLIQLIVESYHLMKQGLDLSNDDLHQVYEGWNAVDLRSYLIEITARIFERKDKDTGEFLVDLILDEAQGKGTGKWTVQDAMDLSVPVPTIAAAVAMRDLSDLKNERLRAARTFNRKQSAFEEQGEGFVTSLHKAMATAMLTVYAQGMAQLFVASRAYGYGLKLDEVARIWTGGCIIRSDLLGLIREAYRNEPSLANLLLDPVVARLAIDGQANLRRIVSVGATHAIPVPAFAASLAYLDAYSSPWLPTNLIQAQRDYFGSHQYRRIDRDGLFHTEWEE
jgi:6-phosphogluconate dehydrogenase